MNRKELELFFAELLSPHLYKDYGPNGLQIEGTDEIRVVAFAVSATIESIQTAIAKKADALVVHHGLFWDFHGVRALVGPFGKRVRLVVEHGMNLFGYHLPLDGHPSLGNAAGIAKELGMIHLDSFGLYEGKPTGVKGCLPTPTLPEDLKQNLEVILNHDVIISTPSLKQPIRSLGIITGGANGGWKDAAKDGLDAYLTGEMSEHDFHDSKEAGVHMFAGGHHATERFGIKQLFREVQKQFPVECIFIDSENPA